jgi:caffeoyl-CoA O-methyltransferase
MTDPNNDLASFQQQASIRQGIESDITRLFAAEDQALQYTLSTASQEGLPAIQISPIQGKFLQLMAAACNARKILEIGSLAGYSGIWLARALPPDGRLITLELNPHHAQVVRKSFARAGVADRTEVRVGKALDLLPQLEDHAPFDLIFIDADKAPYPQYLDWALRYSRPGSIIMADNVIRRGSGLHSPEDEGTKSLYEHADEAVLKGVYEYNQRIASDPRLVSLVLPMDEDYTDGFAISVVKS